MRAAHPIPTGSKVGAAAFGNPLRLGRNVGQGTVIEKQMRGLGTVIKK